MGEIFSNESITHQAVVLLNAFIAAILAGVIGYEREALHKPAGLRTNMIIAAVAVLLVSFGKSLAEEFGGVHSDNRVDPIRTIEAIIVGVSFIGAGTIIKSEAKANVQNLTTAATLLFSAGIGVGVALQQYVLAVGVTFLALFINLTMKRMVGKIRDEKDPEVH